MADRDTKSEDGIWFVGGLRTPLFNAPASIAEASIGDDSIRVRLRSRLLRRLLPASSREIPFVNVFSIDLVRSTIPEIGGGRTGLRIRPRTGSWLVFFAPRESIAELVAALDQHGVSL